MSHGNNSEICGIFIVVLFFCSFLPGEWSICFYVICSQIITRANKKFLFCVIQKILGFLALARNGCFVWIYFIYINNDFFLNHEIIIVTVHFLNYFNNKFKIIFYIESIKNSAGSLKNFGSLLSYLLPPLAVKPDMDCTWFS